MQKYLKVLKPLLPALLLVFIMFPMVSKASPTCSVNPPPAPGSFPGAYVWDNNIQVDGNCNATSTTGAMWDNVTQYTIPGPYPPEFGGPLSITIAEAIAWDGYNGRTGSGEQPNERVKLVFLKNGQVQHSSSYSGVDSNDDGLATGVESDDWVGPIDGQFHLVNGTDEIIIVHYNDATYGEGSGGGSVYPSSLALTYQADTGSLSIGDYVWDDVDMDGVQDGGESPISGVLVELVDSSGATIATDLTDVAGLYEFTDADGLLANTSYTLIIRDDDPVLVAGGYTLTMPNQGSDDALDSDGVILDHLTVPGATAHDGGVSIQSLAYGSQDMTLDFGYVGAQQQSCVSQGSMTEQYIGLMNNTDWNADGRYTFNIDNPGNVTQVIVEADFRGATGNCVPTEVAFNGSNGASQTVTGGKRYEFIGCSTCDMTAFRALLVGDMSSVELVAPDVSCQPIGFMMYVTRSDGGFNNASSLTIIDKFVFPPVSNASTTMPIPSYSQATDYTFTAAVLDAGHLGSQGQIDVTAGGVIDARAWTADPWPPAEGEDISPVERLLVDVPGNTNMATVDMGHISGSWSLSGVFSAIQECNNARSGAIGDFVWYDTDDDGIQDVGEPGIANVTVDLYKDGVLYADTVTDADGGYIFKDLPSGNYIVDVTDQNGQLTDLTLTTGPQSQPDPSNVIALIAGQVYKDADFGYVREPGGGNVIIGDTVWYDGNGDGVQQPWEPGIPSIEIKATNSTGGSHTATTDGNGHYLIEAPQGSYTMSPVNPPAYLIPTTPETVGPTIILAGEQFLDADFGYRVSQPGMIGNLVWEDANKDGDYDGGESPLAGVSVDLIRDANQNGVWDAGDLIIATTTTKSTVDANNGNYLFEGLPSDRYLVHVSDTNAVLVDYVKSVLGAAGVDNNNQADPYPVILAASGQNLTADFGYVKIDLPNTGVIGNQVWIETASNGIYDPAEGDVGQAGVTVALHKDGNPYATTTTGASGDYSFTSLPSGSYTVQVTDVHGVLANYASTVLGPNPGADNNNQAQPYAVALPEKATNLTADFGYVGGGGLQADSTIGNLVWLDINGDGFYDTASEPGIGNVSVELLYDTNKNGVVDGGDISIGTALTSATVTLGGNYLFEGEFRPGDYLVRVTDTNNVLTPYTQTVGANQNDDNFSKTQPYAIEDFNPTGAGNDIDLTADFGYEPPPSNYTISKVLTSGSPARPNEEVTFDITITNTGDTWLAVAPMKDEYDTEYLTYGYQGQFASQNSDDNTNDGTINWSDLTVSFGQDLEPLHSFVVTVHFTAVKDTTALPNETTVNTATVTNAKADPDGPNGPLGSDIPLPEKSDDAEIKIVNPTGLELSSFVAEVEDGGVRVSWETYLELAMLGFNVQRSVAGGDFETLNAELIIAEHAGSAGGGAYEYRDETIQPGETYQYRLEIIKLDGSSVVYGLSEVTPFGLRPYTPPVID